MESKCDITIWNENMGSISAVFGNDLYCIMAWRWIRVLAYEWICSELLWLFFRELRI